MKRTVNFDAPNVYHLYYGDERGDPGSILTFFEFPGAAEGRAGQGMIHRITWRVENAASLDFWADRLEQRSGSVERDEDSVRFADPEGLSLEIAADASGDPPLRAKTADIPAEHALAGFEGVRAYSSEPARSEELLELLGFIQMSEGYRIQGQTRMSIYGYDAAPGRGLQGAGTVHHIAWACRPHEQELWRERLAAAGANVTPIIDRTYFRSIYFREPSGVLFEIATMGPGFDVDEPLESLGDALRLPPQHEHLRAELERTLTPITVPGRD